MVKRSIRSKESEESRLRRGRLSMRVHEDLKRGLDLLAKADRRTTSQYVEILLLDHVRALLKNTFEDDGSLTSKDPHEVLTLQTDRRR
jgi:hypothetical protein